MTELTVNRLELLTALKKVKPGVSTKDLIAEYACVYLSKDMISSFSERMIVSCQFNFTEGLECLVDHSVLVSVLEKLKSETVNISLTENELKLSTDNIESGIATISGKHPDIKMPDELFPFPEDFMEALEFCSFSVSRDMTMPSATCIHVHGDKVLSTDTKRVTQYQMESPTKFDFHVPYIVFKNLKGYNFNSMGKSDNLIHFVEEDGTLFSFYQMEMDREITPEKAAEFFNMEGTEVEFPQGFKEVVDRASVMTEGLIELDFLVEISLAKNKFEVFSKKESGWFREKGNIKYDGEPVKFKTSAPFLVAILSKTNKAKIGKMCLFSGDNFSHVMVMVD
jgi:DNA polymerase III sliding clamp (beta) subunit (PCNA family)